MPFQDNISEKKREAILRGNDFALTMPYNEECRKLFNNFLDNVRTVVRAEGKQQRFIMLEAKPGCARNVLFDSISPENLRGLADAFGVVIERHQGEVIIAQSQGVLNNLNAARGRARSNLGLPKDKVPARAGLKW